MRSVWMFISSLAVVIAIGATAYYFFPKQQAIPAGPFPLVDSHLLVLPAGNPLLAADKTQFHRWLPVYCGADMFLESPPQPHAVEVCVNGTISRVFATTGVRLTRADVLDPRVEAHWREVMGRK
jgi:hypothetical protein